ncbi:MAG: DNA topoisomerase IV subunit A [Bacilli bacterium]|nr:DNA topoisomerase IV subunit A [Bacilli bacterium]
MPKKKQTEEILQKINDYALEEIMGDRFGRYAKEIIQDRAIPDVRDGLKPVQRRILYGMYKSKNTYDNKYRKSARAVGEIMGKYHPHGDSSIYEAMVRMSQDWKMMTPYVDMHGNNGSMDGDSAAAMRYTEVRLSKIAGEILKDIEKDTVEMAPNYDDTELEPTVLPCKFPNLLVNGSTGISAGYATDIPPHNLGEIIDATVLRIDKPNCSIDDILEVVQGPDFPTGGTVEGKDEIRKAMETGKGKIVVKSKYSINNEKGKNQIIITEIPYEVNKSLLVKKINDIRIEKKIDGINEVIDSSSRGELIITIDLKKDANTELILNYLLKNTDMQVTYSYNMVAIVNRRPMEVGIITILDAYINHQKEVITRRSRFDLAHAKARYHIVEGLMKAISILDDVIKTIRASKNRADATENLVKEYDFTFEQADAIVKLQLYRLTNTDILSLQQELENLQKVIEGLEALLSDEKKLLKQIKKELLDIKKEYAIDRKTVIKDEITEIKIDQEALIVKEDVIVAVTKEGYVKRTPKRSYNSSNDEDLTLKENDYLIGLYEMNTIDTLLVFTNLGNYLYIPVHELPDMKWKDMGKHISNIITIKDEEKIVYSMPVYDFNQKEVITIFSKNGMVKRCTLSDFKVQRYNKPITCMKLKYDDEIVSVTNSPYTEVFIATNNAYGLWYSANEIPIVGVRAAGVKAIKLDNDFVVSAEIFDKTAEYITVFTDKQTAKRVKLTELEKSSRARKGLLLVRLVKTNPHKIISAYITNSKEKIGIVNLKGIDVIKNTEITIGDRYSTGSNISSTRIITTFICKELENKDQKVEVLEMPEEQPVKPEVSLQEIDEEILTIDDFLDDFKIE